MTLKRSAITGAAIGASHTRCRLKCRSSSARASRPVAHLAIAFALAVASVLPVAAQEARWKQLNDQAGQLQDQGRPLEALPVAQEAERVAESTFGPEHMYVSVSLNRLASIYLDLGKYSDAEPLFKRALVIGIKTVGPDHPGVGAMLNNIAALYDSQARFAEAEPLYKHALAIDEKALGPNSPHVATDLNNLALMCSKQGRYAEAEADYNRALAIDIKALGPDKPDFAMDLSNLALLYNTEGHFAQAEPLYKRALAIELKALGPYHPSVANTLLNLAAMFDDEGLYGSEEPLLKAALAIYSKALGPAHPKVAATLQRLATFYWRQGRYKDAEPLIMQAGSINQKALGPESYAVADNLVMAGTIYIAELRFAEAISILQRALPINVKVFGAEHRSVAVNLSTLGLAYQGAGRYSDAEIFLKRARDITIKAMGPDHPSVASALNNLGGTCKEEGHYSEAEPLYKRALEIDEKTLGPNHPEVAATVLNLAGLYQAQGRSSDASSYYERGLQILHQRFQYGFAYMSEKDRLQFLATVQDLFSSYFSFVMDQRDPAAAGKMYDVVLWEKGMVGASVSALRAQVAASGDPAAIKLLDDLTTKRNEASQLATSRPPGWIDTQSKLDSEANQLEQQLARRVNAVSERKALATVTWKDVQKALKPDESAVEFVRYHYFDGKKWSNTFYYAALVVTPQAASPSLIALGDAQKLESTPVADFRANVAVTRGVSVEETPQQQAAGAAGTSAAYNAFWKPLEPALGKSKRVYIAPDGVLYQIPLALLADTSGKLLLEKYDLRPVNSTKDVLRPQHAAQSKVAVLVGNPKFDLTDTEQRAALDKLGLGEEHPQPPGSETSASAPATASPASIAGQRSRDVHGGPLKPLPGTQAEVDGVAVLLKNAGWQVDSYTRERALEEVLDHTQRPRIVHVATHGFFLTNQQVARDSGPPGTRPVIEDPMLRSGLFFAGADRAESGTAPAAGLADGVLTAYEAAQLNLQGTELVVLSACETGLGKEQNGEGVFGLRRGLQEAGADAVMMSMWSVPDQETRELMTLFYGKWLGGLDKHEALRQAQLEERTVVRQRYGKDLPYYWGAFVLVGR